MQMAAVKSQVATPFHNWKKTSYIQFNNVPPVLPPGNLYMRYAATSLYVGWSQGSCPALLAATGQLYDRAAPTAHNPASNPEQPAVLHTKH